VVSASKVVDCCDVWPHACLWPSNCMFGGKQGHDLPGGSWKGLDVRGKHLKSVGTKVAVVWAWGNLEVVEVCPSEGLCAPRGYGADSGCPL